jgi:type IV pilus assembly protein PilB
MADIDQTLQFFAREEEEKIAQNRAQKLNLTYINLVGYPIAPDVIRIVPKDLAEQNKIIAYIRIGKKVRLAVPHPEKEDEIKAIIDKLKVATNFEFAVSLCSETSIDYALKLYSIEAPEKPAETKVEVTKEQIAAQEVKNLGELKEQITKVPTTKLLDTVFAGALAVNASDIHIEPEEKDMRLRYRIDGVLQDVAKFTPEAYKSLLSRIKYLSNMKLDLHNIPQDGRFSISAFQRAIDIRSAIIPTGYGEAIVLRLLEMAGTMLKLVDLGFDPQILSTIQEAVSKPNGLILNTGPTGSGKTTTLYAILEQLNKPGVKIITLEDPIEYRVAGIDQVQIKEEEGLTFAKALRASLRQDPDILMVGEVRDLETAETCVQAALTGHLVLSTLHTNNAPAALARLVEMGVKPYLLAGSINLIIAQRLVRKICQQCSGQKCNQCNQTGFKGRIAIIEVLVPTPAIEKLIIEKAPLRTFMETAKKEGMVSMYEDGMKKVAQGITTKEEVERVTKE